MKLVVFAYHDIGYMCLKTLLEWGEEVAAVVTHQDDPEEEVWFRSVADLARSHLLPVLTPDNPNSTDCVDYIESLAPDLIFSFYYRRILSKQLLRIPSLGAINLHGSLLPRYRGRSPLNWAIVNGETKTGVTLHHMTEKVDAGDIISQKPIPILFEDTALTLFQRLTDAAVDLLKDTYRLIKSGQAPRTPQDERLATKFGQRRAEDGKIDWEQPAVAIYNLVRAVTHPYPGAFTFLDGEKLFVWQAALAQRGGEDAQVPGLVAEVDSVRGALVHTASGCLHLTRIQLEGEQEVSALDLARSGDVVPGVRMGR